MAVLKTISEYKDQVSAILSGMNLNSVSDLYGTFERAARTLVQRADIPEASGIQNVTLYSGVFDYEVDTTIFGTEVIDIRPQGISRPSWETATKTTQQQFDRLKNYAPNNISSTFQYENGVPIIRINAPFPNQNTNIDPMTSIGNWVASGTASGLTQDTSSYYQSPASLRYTLSGNGNPTVNVLVVGGGGCGGYTGGASISSGGGGGGEVYSNTAFSVTPQAYTITIGAGGLGTGSNNGASTIFSSITAVGGGAGDPADGITGASGGGGGSYGPAHAGAVGTVGGNGGNGNSGTNGGGGGGDGGNGGNATATVAGVGGSGTTSTISGSSVTYGGGGGGGSVNTTAGLGTDGGGNGATGSNPGSNGTANRGGGGGGGGNNQAGGNGGSGVVVIAYKTDGTDGVSPTSTGGTITTSGEYTIHTFTTSGTWTMVASGLGMLTETLTSSIDISSYEDVGVAFIANYIPSNASNYTSMTLKLGSDSSNYDSVTATTPFIGAFTNNLWQLVAFDFSTATTTGTPDWENISYIQIIDETSGDITNIRKGDLFISQPTPSQILYGSAAIFLPSGSTTPLTTITSNTDTIILNNPAYNIYLYEGALAVLENTSGGMGDAMYERITRKLNGDGTDKNIGLYGMFRGDNPSQELRTTSSYYDVNNGGGASYGNIGLVY